MIRLSLAVLLLASPVLDLAPAQLKTLRLRVPAVWTHTDDQGTQVYTSPAKDAQLLVDIGTTRSQLDPTACRDKIVHAMGDSGWTLVSVGAQPAARKTDEDVSPDQQTVVDTVTYVGCDGRTSWSLQFRIDAHKKDKFTPLVDQVVQSVRYVR